MASINKTEFKVLELNGKNYQTWALDCEFHLEAMQLTATIARPAAGVPAPPPYERAKACIFLRHHIHPDLKMEYLEVKRPSGAVVEASGAHRQAEGSAPPTS